MQQTDKHFIIAIDGHSSTGKSTVAKSIARKLNISYIDTGAMYRAVTLFALRNGCLENGIPNIDKLESVLGDISIDFSFSPEQEKNITFLNGEDVEDEIRGMDVSSNVSAVSAVKSVREKLVFLQRQIGEKYSVVMDGRDIGSVVFPDADLKIFMTASAEVRAQRRYDELIAKGETVAFADILKNVTDRDRQDSTRKESPLVQAPGALLLDNSTLTREDQLSWIEEKVQSLRSAI